MDITKLKGEVALVANAEVIEDWSSEVDATDTVIRFNSCESFAQGTGRKTDLVALNNVAQPAINMLVSGLPSCVKGAHVFFCRSPETHFRFYGRCQIHKFPKCLVNVQTAMIRHLAIRNFSQLSASEGDEIFERLIDFDGQADFVMPSAGFTILEILAKARSCSVVKLVGFTFEGWHGHPWQKERTIAEQYNREGFVRFLK